jgi:hypothetical protein
MNYGTSMELKGFYISEGEYLTPAIFHEEGKVVSQMIYSNVRELVEHQVSLGRLTVLVC